MDSEATEEPRGVKRKLDVVSVPMPRRIRPLEQNVVNKIAAGEIIIAPMHALKEMIENSVDAGATSIEIVVRDGGMKMLQITDNGHGISPEDLPILCERFTTSKLRSFEDLTSIATYGFRGEALASISHIAHLRVTTRTSNSDCAYQAHFQDGQLTVKGGSDAGLKKTAGRVGTQITVEDLFYNVPQRKKAFRSHSEEYAKLLDVVGRYAIHCDNVSFSCRKQNETTHSLIVSGANNLNERIGTVYGQNLPKELLHFKAQNPALGFSASGAISTANYQAKKAKVLLFINHRSVESAAVKAAVLRLYSVYLPKGSQPFIYVDLHVRPENVDVNVHPTKREVSFLNEDDIISEICTAIGQVLAKSDASRTFLTQSTLPNTKATVRDGNSNTLTNPPGTTTRPMESNFVRTDPYLQKITSMLPKADHDNLVKELNYDIIDRSHMQVRLSSVKELKASVRSDIHEGLTETFGQHTWIGIVDADRRVAAIQAGIKLLLVDYGLVCSELFYQIGLSDFGNFGSIVFKEPLDISQLIRCAADIEQSLNPDIDLTSAPDKVTKRLIASREMLHEYFRMDISEDGKLHAIPLLVKDYVPCLAKLPTFLLRLGPCVVWNQEKKCFDSFLRELASFYTPEQLPPVSNDNIAEHDATIQSMRGRAAHVERALEHVLFPAFKSRLVATKSLLNGVLEVANLKGLYKVFERC